MSKPTFQVGQRVNFKFGTRDMQGVVKEDRGPIGMKGRVLYRIEFRFDAEAPDLSYIELPADRLTKVERTISNGSATG